MTLDNTAVPVYYGQFRDAVMAGEIPVCETIAMEMARIDELIANPGVYYDEEAINGYIKFCENELTLTDGGDLFLLDTFKLWAEQIFGWYYFVNRSVFVPNEHGGGRYVQKRVKKRLVNKQYLIIPRGAAKSMYAATIQGFYLNVDTTTTLQIATAPVYSRSVKERRRGYGVAHLHPRGHRLYGGAPSGADQPRRRGPGGTPLPLLPAAGLFADDRLRYRRIPPEPAAL